MPMPFHLSLTGKDQGLISQGAGQLQGREDTILCQALKHEIEIPTDRQSGQPAGKRVHKNLIITKVFDRTSPKLYQALARGERMTDVTLQFYRINETGNEEHYFTILLEDAVIVSIQPWIPNCLDPSQESLTHMEDVSFRYRRITWTYEPDKVVGSDDWTAPGGGSA